jgi:restriction system protein
MGYRATYEITISHDGLNKVKCIRGTDKSIVEQKAAAQSQIWNIMWEKKLADMQRQDQTRDAQKKLDELNNILIDVLSVADFVDWNELKKLDPFPEKQPSKPELHEIPAEPDMNWPIYQPNLSVMDKLFSSRTEKRVEEKRRQWLADHNKWRETKARFDLGNKDLINKYKQEVYMWNNRKQVYEKELKEYNDKIEAIKSSYLHGEINAILEYCDLVLSRSKYPDFFQKSFELDYNPENKILIVEYQLPSKDDFPTLKEVKYIQSKNEFKEYHISNEQLNKLFDSVIYQTTLRTIYELFKSDNVNAIDAISMNGWTNFTNRATGKEENICILSIQVKKNDLLEIDLSKVDPKICFKSLKGVAASKLSSITPIKPILKINKDDNRFIQGYDVANSVEETTNLAAMDWEDFEHLIRELFEKEFKHSGGEVKITRASRDKGVDAVAFDPDPIRGGKIVIQAKRYTNTVDVAAVRDLFGTVMNEGATK